MSLVLILPATLGIAKSCCYGNRALATGGEVLEEATAIITMQPSPDNSAKQWQRLEESHGCGWLQVHSFPVS